jgi:hypothetical protein
MLALSMHVRCRGQHRRNRKEKRDLQNREGGEVGTVVRCRNDLVALPDSHAPTPSVSLGLPFTSLSIHNRYLSNACLLYLVEYDFNIRVPAPLQPRREYLRKICNL